MSIASADTAYDLSSLEPISIETTMEPGIDSVSPPASDSSNTLEQWKQTGRCAFCLEHLEAIQPGGRNPRHIASKAPYFDCVQAQRMPSEAKRGGDISKDGKPDRELFAKMDHYRLDIRDVKHWRYVRETTGGGHHVLNPVFPGEEL